MYCVEYIRSDESRIYLIGFSIISTTIEQIIDINSRDTRELYQKLKTFIRIGQVVNTIEHHTLIEETFSVVNVNVCVDYVLKPQIGDVVVNGKPFMSSLGELKGKLLTNYQGKIDKLAIGNDKPYHIFGKGWFSLDNQR